MSQIYQKTENETLNQYVTRMYELKDELGLSWGDIADFTNCNFGTHMSWDACRKHVNSNGHVSAKRVQNKYSSDLNTSDDQLTTIRKERYRLADERSQVNALYRRIAREDSLKEMAHDAALAISKKIKLDPPRVLYKQDSKDRVAILQLSDVHYGIEDTTLWNKYSPEIAKQRLQKLQNKVIEFLQKEGISTLYLVNLGDMIGGRIHLQLRLNSRIDVVTQATQISEIISEFTNNLSNYAKIHCYFTTDNHGRLEPNIKDAEDLESLSRLVPWYMQARLGSNKNIEFHVDSKLGDDIITFNVFNHKVACCHGHKDKPSKIVSNLSLYTQEHYDLILSSHFHHLAVEEENQTVVIYNGSVMATDSFAEKLRCNSRPSQNLIICSRDNAMECLYKINLD